MREQEIKIPIPDSTLDIFNYFKDFLVSGKRIDGLPVRFAITKTDENFFHCEVGTLLSNPTIAKKNIKSIFDFNKREIENSNEFNALLIVPTGIGSDIGGHAGDAGPIAKLLASACDNLITHPNVVNASDINEMTENTLYVEGSVMSRLLMGTVGLQKVRNNRILMIIDDHEKDVFVNAAINSVNGAIATYGLDCPEVIKLNPPIEMSAEFSTSGMAVGNIVGIRNLFKLLDERKDEFDAIALSSVIHVPYDWHSEYFEKAGQMLNPWGGVEAMLTHVVSHIYNLPSAHSPMFENEDIANMDPGIVDPRMAAEAVSLTFLQCILKGLKRSPKIVTDKDAMNKSSVITAEDISCIIIPDNCIGLPTLAALKQGISVIAVKDNSNVMENDLSKLPWKPNQFYYVNNYLEAVGVLTAIKSGLNISSIRRPLKSTNVSTSNYNSILLDIEKSEV